MPESKSESHAEGRINRPTTVTLVAFLFIAAGAAAIAYHSGEILLSDLCNLEVVAALVIRLLAIAGGVFVLRGKNWARWLLVTWIVYHAVLGAFHSPAQFLMHVAIAVMVCLALFHRHANAFFDNHLNEQMKPSLIVKSLLITLLLPGTVTLLVPYLIVRPTTLPVISFQTGLTVAVIVAGYVVLLNCIWNFAEIGKGTLAPIDPPKTLIVSGLYRYTRNPMYLAVITILLAEALLFSSLELVLYAGIIFLMFHLFVVFYEEPHLRRHFAPSYDRYAASVPRWTGRKSPYSPR